MESGIYEGGPQCGSGNCASVASLKKSDFVAGFVKVRESIDNPRGVRV